MKVSKFDVLGRVSKTGVLGRSARVLEAARITLDSPVFPEVIEAQGRRTLRRNGELFSTLDGKLERVGGHEIEVSSAHSETEITIEYLVGYEF